ncbi:MAG: hypothetical protein CL398_06420 [Acidiferrobacteraceae bacterium]|nr:hypothetical protein [Acidiferrobacteraceae bacterium]
MIAAMLIVPFMDAIAKSLSSRFPILQIVWGRFFFHFIIIAPLVFYREKWGVFSTEKPFWQISRGLFLLAATLCFFGAIKYIPLADATALIFFDAVIVVGLSSVILKEKVSVSRWLASGLGLVGVLIIVRPGFEEFHWASLSALAASAFFALYLLSTRFLSEHSAPLTTLLYQSVGGFVLMSIAMPFVWVTPRLFDLLLMATIGLTGAIGHLLLIRAFQDADASLLAPYRYAEIIMQVILGFWLFGDLPDIWAWLGIALIISVGIFLSMLERTLTTIDDDQNISV